MAEHSHLFQHLPRDDRERLARLIASEPFRTLISATVLPRWQQARARLERAEVPYEQTQFFRGVVDGLGWFVTVCCEHAQLPNPLAPALTFGPPVAPAPPGVPDVAVPEGEEGIPVPPPWAYGSRRQGFPA